MKKNLLLFLSVIIPSFLAAQSVFINEIHYDNTGTDAGEGIEIAGPAGTNLTGWTLVGYNGNSGATYSTVTLGGAIPAQQNGYGTLWFAFLGLQNGAPDGIALVDPQSTVIQFLSYEGSFIAIGGPADGMTSDDIGVYEPASPADQSLQLSGQGNEYSVFTWNAPATHTKGVVNTNQTLIDQVPPEWNPTFPFLNNILDTRGDLNVSLDEPATVYYMINPDGSTPPTSLQVKAGVDFADVTIYTSGSFSVTKADSLFIEVLWGSSPETAYDIYVVAEDNAATPNLQTNPVLLETTTTPARSLIITNPVTKNTYDVGSNITFSWTSANIDSIYIGGYDYSDGSYFILSDETTWEPYKIDASLGTFDYTIPNSASTDSVDIIMWDAVDSLFQDIVRVIYLRDLIPPVLSGTYPANNATDVWIETDPQAGFDEEIFAGAGNIVIKNEDGSVFETLDINAKGSIVINDWTMTINPTNPFSTGSKYYIEMDAGVVVDFKDNPFAGISGIDTWNFTTTPSSDATLADLQTNGFTVDGFNPTTLTYTVVLASGTTAVPVISATPANEHAVVVITDAANVTGTAPERTGSVAVTSQDGNTTITYNVTYQVATVVNKSLENQLRIFPVPATTELTIQNLNDVQTVEILDITGSVKSYINLTGERELVIPVSDLSRGIYFIRFRGQVTNLTRRFIKK